VTENKNPVSQKQRALIARQRGLKMLRERAARGNVEAALAILDRVPDVPPDEGDELPERAKKRRS
jgi:hypothetical protein